MDLPILKDVIFSDVFQNDDFRQEFANMFVQTDTPSKYSPKFLSEGTGDYESSKYEKKKKKILKKIDLADFQPEGM